MFLKLWIQIFFRLQLEATKRELIQQKKQQYIRENAVLSEQVEKLKTELISLEKRNGKQQIPIPGDAVAEVVEKSSIIAPTTPISLSSEAQSKPTQAKEKKPKKEKSKAAPETTSDGGSGKKDEDVHVGLLDMRIGKIVEITQHPDADSLYLEKIDCGENTPRTVISGLVKHVPIDEMKDRLVVVLCNLKPAKMRGIISEAMVMCASTPEKVEVLSPPNGSIPGDLVYCEGYERNAPSQLNPKKKIFETVAVDLKTNSDLIGCYKDKPLYVPNKGNITSKSLKNVNIKWKVNKFYEYNEYFRVIMNYTFIFYLKLNTVDILTKCYNYNKLIIKMKQILKKKW